MSEAGWIGGKRREERRGEERGGKIKERGKKKNVEIHVGGKGKRGERKRGGKGKDRGKGGERGETHS